MDIYPSYTYYLRWTSQNKSYYGVRTANKAAPHDDLWTNYFTSSKLVAALREEHGEPDVILIDEVFQTPEDAIAYEVAFLQGNGWQSDEWLNQACFPTRNMAGYTHTQETKNKISKARKGMVFSEEHKQNIAKSGKGRTPWNKGKKLGPLPKETRDKMSEAGKRKVFSEEHRMNLSRAGKGNTNSLGKSKPFSEEHKRKLSEAAKLRHAKNRMKNES